MYVKVINPKIHGKTEYNNSGSCSALVEYLKKEDEGKGLDKEFYFSHDKDRVLSSEVLQSIDNNCPSIVKGEARFYSLVVAPRPDEMDHIGNDKARLKQYVRDTMDIYAGNFNGKNGTSKNLTANDLVYYAKLEEKRYYKGTDEAVKQGKAKQGDVMPGDNTHVHVIVSRTDKSKIIKLSPLVNSKKLFSRENFKMNSCKHFDQHYLYEGAGKELEKHIVMRDGTLQERADYINKEYARNKEYESSSIENDLLKIGRLNHTQGQQNPDEKKKKKKDEERRRGLSM
jgi:hypothetical protein